MQSVSSNAVATTLGGYFSSTTKSRTQVVGGFYNYASGLAIGVCAGQGSFSFFFSIAEGTVTKTNILNAGYVSVSYNNNTRELTLQNTLNYYIGVTVIWHIHPPL